jgi:predicted amidohydrolase
MRDLRISLVQADLAWHDPAANLVHLDRQLGKITDSVDVIVLPEMFTTGFSMNAPELAEPDGGPSAQWLQRQAETFDALVTGSIITKDGAEYYNRMYWAFPGGKLVSYDKRHLFRMAKEQEHYTPGDKRLILDWRSWRINAIVCYDLRFPAWIRNSYDGTQGSGYDLLVCIANWPERRKDHWRRLLAARGIENLCYVAGVNRVGTDGNGIYYSGNSLLADWHGDVQGEIANGEGVQTLSLSRSALDEWRSKFPAWEDTDAYTLSIPTHEEAAAS